MESAVLVADVLHFPFASQTPPGDGTTHGDFVTPPATNELPHIWGVVLGHVHTHVDLPTTL